MVHCLAFLLIQQGNRTQASAPPAKNIWELKNTVGNIQGPYSHLVSSLMKKAHYMRALHNHPWKIPLLQLLLCKDSIKRQ